MTQKMPFHKFIIIYVASLVMFLVLDFIWLGWAAQPFYHGQLETLLNPRVNWPSAIAFYLTFIAGLMIFCIVPAIKRGSLASAAILGGLYGFFTYSTYELTNHALIRHWPAALVPVDIFWGVVLCAAVSVWGSVVGRWRYGRV